MILTIDHKKILLDEFIWQVITEFLKQESENLHDDLLLSDQDLVMTFSIYFARSLINMI